VSEAEVWGRARAIAVARREGEGPPAHIAAHAKIHASMADIGSCADDGRAPGTSRSSVFKSGGNGFETMVRD